MAVKQILAGATLAYRPTLHVILKSFEVLRGTLRKLLPLGAAQLQAQLLGNLFRDLFLHREHIGELAIVLLPPDLAVVSRVDNSTLIARPSPRCVILPVSTACTPSSFAYLLRDPRLCPL